MNKRSTTQSARAFTSPLHSLIIFGITLPLLLSACGGANHTQDAPESSVKAPRFEAKSPCGNQQQYTINGTQYQVLDSAKGYQANGVASWYGLEYQGSETASCEKFDMYAHTAAHRTLPLPSYVRVTNKKNNKSVIVRINDRGPFDSQNEIELSFAAANALDMVKSKTASVTVTAITPDEVEGQITVKTQVDPPKINLQPATPSQSAENLQYAKAKYEHQKEVFYIIAGTFTNKDESLERFIRLSSIGISKAEMATAFGDDRELYMVRIGPLYHQDQIDNIKDRLSGDGLSNFKVIKETLKKPTS
ncbi:MAG TPA: septal ring lytic transglycosylase RlpA family protein [Thiothrix sp.]|nr:septal ring lytic transglycosylase RlpA family protein [Thiothrix sp.]